MHLTLNKLLTFTYLLTYLLKYPQNFIKVPKLNEKIIRTNKGTPRPDKNIKFFVRKVTFLYFKEVFFHFLNKKNPASQNLVAMAKKSMNSN